MKTIGIFKADTLIGLANWVGIPIIVLYLVSMFFAPWFQGTENWLYVQSVWDRWQTLNAGMLAFIASLIAFNIARYNEARQRERQFIAARAFLPHALSDLIAYCKSSSVLLREAWGRLDGNSYPSPLPLANQPPKLPNDFKEIFSRCIEDAEPDIADHLAGILVALQIHHARLKDLVASAAGENQMLIMKQNLMSYIYSLGEIQALLNRTFPFARGTDPFDHSVLAWEDFHNAYANLDVFFADIDDLEGFTKRAIARQKAT